MAPILYPKGWVTAESSNVARFRYDDGTLTVEFKRQSISNSIYLYFDVPPDVYAGLLEAESKGKYLHAHVLKHYIYRKVE